MPHRITTAERKRRDYLRRRGLATGADDYVVKPFSLPELIARIQALLRRAKPGHVAGLLAAGDLELDRTTRRVRRAGASVRGVRRWPVG